MCHCILLWRLFDHAPSSKTQRDDCPWGSRRQVVQIKHLWVLFRHVIGHWFSLKNCPGLGRLLACWVRESFRILVTSPTLLPQIRPETAHLFNILKHTTVIAFRTSTIRCLVLGVLLFPTAQCTKLCVSLSCVFFINRMKVTTCQPWGNWTSPWCRLCFKELFRWPFFCSGINFVAGILTWLRVNQVLFRLVGSQF